jgi:RNA polymerase sigma-54 factor
MSEMRLNQSLRLTQTQKLVLTQKIRQALEILQLPSLEMENMIVQELQENPLLEKELDQSQEAPAKDKEDKPEGDEEERPWEEEPTRSDAFETDPLDILRQIEEHMGESDLSQWSPEEDSWRPEPAGEQTLSEYLLTQIYALMLPPDLEEAVLYVVYSLDRHGLLSLPVYELLAGWTGRPTTLSHALEIVKSLEPVGIGSGSVVEALQLQLQGKGFGPGSIEYRIVTAHFSEMAEKRYREIAAAEHCSTHEVQQAVDMISTLSPWPGNEFSSGSNAVVIPDIIITRIGDHYEAMLNDGRFPRLTISTRNRRILESPGTSDTERDYVKKKYQRASWFIKAIAQRQETVTRIGTFLADYQADFFENGIEGLKPLTLQMVADALGCNQSTISRAINGKWVQSPRGVHEMRFYFSRALPGVHGSDVSARTVKDDLRKLIESEDKASPLSDADLADALAAAGMEVKRRTVANYRTEMDFPSARKRRRY